MRGVAKGPEQRGIEGVRIVLTDSSSAVISETYSKAEGKYEFSGLASGTYGLLAEKDGFAASTATGIQVKQQTITFVDLKLGSVESKRKKGNVYGWRRP